MAIADEKTRELLDEYKRILKPGGSIVVDGARVGGVRIESTRDLMGHYDFIPRHYGLYGSIRNNGEASIVILTIPNNPN